MEYPYYYGSGLQVSDLVELTLADEKNQLSFGELSIIIINKDKKVIVSKIKNMMTKCNNI